MGPMCSDPVWNAEAKGCDGSAAWPTCPELALPVGTGELHPHVYQEPLTGAASGMCRELPEESQVGLPRTEAPPVWNLVRALWPWSPGQEFLCFHVRRLEIPRGQCKLWGGLGAPSQAQRDPWAASCRRIAWAPAGNQPQVGGGSSQALAPLLLSSWSNKLAGCSANVLGTEGKSGAFEESSCQGFTEASKGKRGGD